MWNKITKIFHNQKVKRNLSFYPQEVLLRNRLDRDVQRIFYPLNFPLILLFSSKYAIRDNYITPNGKIRIISSLLSVCYVFVTCIYCMYFEGTDNSCTRFYKDIISSVLAYFDFINFIISVGMIFILNMLHSQNNILLIGLIQTIHKGIDFKSIMGSVIGNWISVVISFGGNCFIWLVLYTQFSNMHLPQLIRNYILVEIDMHCVYAIRIMALLTKYLNEWIKTILKLAELQENNTLFCIKLFNIYRNILNAYKLYTTIFQVLVSTATNYSKRNGVLSPVCFF